MTDTAIATTHKALKTLGDSIILFGKFEKTTPHSSPQIDVTSLRDSMIKRFSYCADLFFKAGHDYLTDVELMNVYMLCPRGVIREMAKIKVITEDEATLAMKMLTSRNETSHAYHQKIADKIAQQIPTFFELMQAVVTRIQGRVNG